MRCSMSLKIFLLLLSAGSVAGQSIHSKLSEQNIGQAVCSTSGEWRSSSEYEKQMVSTKERVNFAFSKIKRRGSVLTQLQRIHYTFMDQDAEDYFVYTVEKGDSLWGIAEEYLQNGEQYALIYRRNLESIDSWNRRYGTAVYDIHPGQMLVLPIPPGEILSPVIRVRLMLAVIRKEPTANSEQLDQYPEGAMLKLLGLAVDSEGELWVKAEREDQQGYVGSDLLRDGEIVIPPGQSLVLPIVWEDSVPEKVSIVPSGVHMREEPSTESERVAGFNGGTELSLLGIGFDATGNLWCKLEYAGIQGYIRSDLLTIKP